MKDPGCGAEAWEILDGKLWHATSVQGLRGILAERCIRPGTRYKSSFVQAKGWVSLFDFGTSATDNSGQFGNWCGWFGFAHEANLSIWIEIDRNEGKGGIVEAEELRLMWHEEMARPGREDETGKWSGNIFPGVEGAYRGAVPIDLLKQATVMGADYSAHEGLGNLESIREETIAELTGRAERPQGTMIERLLEGRKRRADPWTGRRT